MYEQETLLWFRAQASIVCADVSEFCRMVSEAAAETRTDRYPDAQTHRAQKNMQVRWVCMIETSDQDRSAFKKPGSAFKRSSAVGGSHTSTCLAASLFCIDAVLEQVQPALAAAPVAVVSARLMRS